MKQIHSYTSIWSVEKVLYAINDVNLPFPVTFTQMTWFIVLLALTIFCANIPPLSLIHGAFLKFLGIPAGLTWFLSQKTFDNKQPLGFLKSLINYWITPKLTFGQRPVKTKRCLIDCQITHVRRWPS